jgi:hypothetical protein
VEGWAEEMGMETAPVRTDRPAMRRRKKKAKKRMTTVPATTEEFPWC